VWFRERRITGVGASTLRALRELAIGAHWALVGAKGDRAAGNGSAMRIAPLAFLLDPEKNEDRRLVRDVSRITHHHEEAYTGALAVLAAVRFAYEGDWDGSAGLIARVAQVLPDSVTRDRLRALAAESATPDCGDVAARFGNSGYVAGTVPLALTATVRLRDSGFSSILWEIIRCGGDTGTAGSFFGQIAGAHLGASALPADLVRRIDDEKLVTSTAEALAVVVTQSAGH